MLENYILQNVQTFEHYESKEILNQKAETLLKNYGDNILRLSYSYLHNINDAEDVLQDTLMQFLRTAPRLETPQHEKAWLLRVAGNISKNKIRYNRIRHTDELNDLLISEEKEDLSFVWNAVKSLPIKYSEVIHLYYYEGYSTKQIADLLRKSESTIRSHLYRGRLKLKKVLKEVYDFE